jgi:hypothetical protein
VNSAVLTGLSLYVPPYPDAFKPSVLKFVPTFAFSFNLSIIMAEEKNQPNQLNIELPEEIAEGIYANLAIISHSHSEFVVDFIRMMPNVPKAKVKARVILTPQHAKRLMRALADNIKKFENQFGTIDETDQNVNFPPMNFNTPKAQA